MKATRQLQSRLAEVQDLLAGIEEADAFMQDLAVARLNQALEELSASAKVKQNASKAREMGLHRFADQLDAKRREHVYARMADRYATKAPKAGDPRKRKHLDHLAKVAQMLAARAAEKAEP